jgi:Flp pilus assembly protein TadG
MNKVQMRKVDVISCSEGGSLIESALVLPIFMLLIFAAFDFGSAYYQSIKVASAAHAGSTYGLQNPQDVNGMENAALVGVSNVPGMTANATYGCECSDGTSAVASCTTTPSCTSNYVTYVDVTTNSTFQPLFDFPGIPTSFTIGAESRLRVGGN